MGLSQNSYFFAWILSAYFRTMMGAMLFVIPPLAVYTAYTIEYYPYFPYFFVEVPTNYPLGLWDMYAAGNVGKFLLCFFFY